jgi:hypothetical protein
MLMSVVALFYCVCWKYMYIMHLSYIVMDLINALPGNSSVNTVQHSTIDKAVFSVVRATPSAGNGRMKSQSDT